MLAALCKSHGCFKPILPTVARGYALSRFPDRRPGVGRKRETFRAEETVRPYPAVDEVPREESPSVEGSPLWHESFRPPSGDPEYGLNKLLMSNETLVVTRLVHFA